jgi:hypothetical protein
MTGCGKVLLKARKFNEKTTSPSSAEADEKSALPVIGAISQDVAAYTPEMLPDGDLQRRPDGWRSTRVGGTPPGASSEPGLRSWSQRGSFSNRREFEPGLRSWSQRGSFSKLRNPVTEGSLGTSVA